MKNLLTLKWITSKLRIDGWNSKEKVINAIEYATVEDLKTLKRSIDEELAQREMQRYKEKK